MLVRENECGYVYCHDAGEGVGEGEKEEGMRRAAARGRGYEWSGKHGKSDAREVGP